MNGGQPEHLICRIFDCVCAKSLQQQVPSSPCKAAGPRNAYEEFSTLLATRTMNAQTCPSRTLMGRVASPPFPSHVSRFKILVLEPERGRSKAAKGVEDVFSVPVRVRADLRLIERASGYSRIYLGSDLLLVSGTR